MLTLILIQVAYLIAYLDHNREAHFIGIWSPQPNAHARGIGAARLGRIQKKGQSHGRVVVMI